MSVHMQNTVATTTATITITTAATTINTTCNNGNNTMTDAMKILCHDENKDNNHNRSSNNTKI